MQTATTTTTTATNNAANVSTCWKCNGSGKFYFRGAIVNGVFTGKIDICYACKGKGTQTKADEKRNRAYWHLNGARIAGGY